MTSFPSKKNHLMLDIETMSLHPSNALILSIGMVRFDPWVSNFRDCIESPGRRLVPSITSQLLLGREVSKSTQEFWQKQEEKASAHWRNNQPVGDNLGAMCAAIKDEAAECQTVWANGIIFDLGNVIDFYHQVTGAAEPPWHYRAPRDMRTFCEETPPTKGTEVGDAIDLIEEFKIIPHEPISDCIVQIHRVWEHWPCRQA